MASSIGNDLRGADLAMEALGSSLKTTLTAIAMVRLDNSWIDVIVFHHPPGVFDDSGRGAYMSVHVKLTPNKQLRDVRDDFEKFLNPKVEMKFSEPKRMYAVKSKPQPKGFDAQIGTR